MGCPQEKVLARYGLLNNLLLEVENILRSNSSMNLNAYDIYNALSPNLKQQIVAMINSIKTVNISLGKQITGGFYEEASFAGVAAALLEQTNSNIIRSLRYSTSCRKQLPHFCWI